MILETIVSVSLLALVVFLIFLVLATKAFLGKGEVLLEMVLLADLF